MSKDGINIKEALTILHERHAHDDDHGECKHVPTGAETMGQHIDLNEFGSDKGGKEPLSAEEEEKMKRQAEEEKQKRQAELMETLKSMSLTDILRAALKVQEERVATYRNYERSLESTLDSQNMTIYINGCAAATSAFGVQSDTINAIKSILESEKKRPDLVKQLLQLQQQEKEKLFLTAALHLERIRERNLSVATSDEDERISNLLKSGVQSLRSRIDKCVEGINEVLDELRCALLEEDE